MFYVCQAYFVVAVVFAFVFSHEWMARARARSSLFQTAVELIIKLCAAQKVAELTIDEPKVINDGNIIKILREKKNQWRNIKIAFQK